MDVLYFLKERTAFIRQFYEVAAAPYLERHRKIEAGEDPFEQPYVDESSIGEPAYLKEYGEADESLHVLAYSCVSMLAAALHLYFTTWEKLFQVSAAKAFKAEFKKGWLAGYNAYLTHHIGVSFENCPANLKLLEEVIIVRNRIEHPESSVEHHGAIANVKTHFSASDLKKLPHPFFLDKFDRDRLAELGDMDEAEKAWLVSPTLHVTGEKLIAAIAEVETFCGWLEEQILTAVRRRSP